jgi:hypothetical protein
MKAKNLNPVALGILLSATMLWQGCAKNPVEPQVNTLSVNEDVAASVAGNLGQDTGGAMDQINDLLSLTTGTPLSKNIGVEQVEDKNAVYDEATATWTATVSRERGSAAGSFYAQFSRVYTYQFINKNGQPQKNYITGNDTARTIYFKVLEGTGRHHTLRISQQLLSISASFTATGVNTPTVVINGSSKRAAVDTLTTLRVVRVHQHSTELNFSNVTGPRGTRLDLTKKVSGTVTGTYSATITFLKGEGYEDRTVQRDINITLGTGESLIRLDGYQFKGNLSTGDLN